VAPGSLVTSDLSLVTSDLSLVLAKSDSKNYSCFRHEGDIGEER